MPQKTAIEWADYSTNPLRARQPGGKTAWSCAKVGPECLNCYSEAINKRFGDGLAFTRANAAAASHELNVDELRQILRFKPRGPFKGGRDRPAVFPFDMTDVFGEWIPNATLDIIFAVFALRPDVDFLILTKRAKRMREYWTAGDVGRRIYRQVSRLLDDGATGLLGREWDRVADLVARSTNGGPTFDSIAWRLPLPNLWLGVSGGAQKFAEPRLRDLYQTPAAVRFLSAEPLIDAIDFETMTTDPLRSGFALMDGFGQIDGEGPPLLRWVIAGGESGPKARPCDVANIRRIVDQCKAAGVACFVKQLGAKPFDSSQRSPNENYQTITDDDLAADPAGVAEALHDALKAMSMPFVTASKGNDPSEWPSAFRVREWPTIAGLAGR